MQCFGSNLTLLDGKTLIRIRNRSTTYLVVTPNLLDNLGNLRYMSLYIDFADQVWIKTPAGKQKALVRPYDLLKVIDTGSSLHTISQ